MNRLTLLAVMCAAAAACNAEVWSLDSCVSYAIDNNLTVQQRQLQTLTDRHNITVARDAVLPTVTAQAGQNWSFGRGLTMNNTYDDRNTSSFSLQAGLSLPLFNGLQTYRNIKVAKASLLAGIEDLFAAKDDITLQVMAQYLQALYCGELEGVAVAQAELNAEELKRRQALCDAGKIPAADVLDAKSQLAQSELQVVSARNDRALALLNLQQLLRLNVDPDFEVMALEGDPATVTLRDPAAVYAAALQGNHAVLAGQMHINVADRQIELAKTGYIPRLSFTAGLGDNYYRTSGMQNESFGQQFRHNFSQYVGFSLNIPIFDAFGTRNNIRSARLQRLSSELNLETQKDNLYRAIYETYYQAVAARERFTASTAAAEASAANLAAVQEKYGIGRATPVDFDNARTQHFQNLSDRTRARYEVLLRARILDFYATPRPYLYP